MQTIAWILLAITSLSLLVRREGLVFSWLFICSAILGFAAFGLTRGLGYLVLLIGGSLLFYLIERLLSIRMAVRLAKEDVAKGLRAPSDRTNSDDSPMKALR